MKNIFKLNALILICFTLFSCSINNQLLSNNHEDIKTGLKKNTDFVQLKNGDFIYFNTLKLVKGFLQAPHLIGDDHLTFVAKDLKAYQINGDYAISQSQFANGLKSKVSVDALPGFAKRVVTGNLNVYCKKYFNGRSAVNEFYIQQGEKGKIFVYHPATLKLMLEDDKNDFFDIDNSNLAVLDVSAADY